MLKNAGFGEFSPRTAWRYHADRIDVVNFQSFNKYNADVLGVTTFSFCVNLGCFLTDIPSQYPVKQKGGTLVPPESQAQFRARLQRSMFQFWNKHKDLWLIDEAGKSLDKSIADVLVQMRNFGLHWFEQFADRGEILRILQNEPEHGTLWGFGANPSPIRSYLTGYVALRLGDRETAQINLEAAARSGCFKELFDDADAAVQRAL